MYSKRENSPDTEERWEVPVVILKSGIKENAKKQAWVKGFFIWGKWIGKWDRGE